MSRVVLHECSLFDTFYRLEPFEGVPKPSQRCPHLPSFLSWILDLPESDEIRIQILSVVEWTDHGLKNGVEVAAVVGSKLL